MKRIRNLQTAMQIRNIVERLLALRGNRRGNVMVEFALGSLILVPLFAGAFRFGWTVLEYNNLENAVTRGARWAAQAPYDSASSTPSTAFANAVKNVVVYGAPVPAAGATAVLPGLTTDNVVFDSTCVTFTNGVPTAMTVKITGYTINALFASTTLTNKPAATFAYQGIWSPL
jgi:Flp pilus assembly protein TadG